MISGIPASVTNSPRTMVLKVFEALGIPELAVDVLDVRCLTKKDSSVIGDHHRPSAAGGTSLSFIVTLKSRKICDHIVSRNCQIKNLTINKIFAVDWPGKIFVGEFLPAAVYGLLRRTKIVTAQRGYKHIWVGSKEICVCKLDGSDIVVIRSDEDLGKLERLIPFDVFCFSRRP